MQALGFVGSPRRRGNTALLVASVLEGLESGGYSVDTVRLSGLTIAECDGCHACWRGKSCSKGDDMNALYPRIAQADVLVFGTPVYWYGPTALMKGLIDRFVYFNCAENRPQIRGKRAALVAPMEEEDPAAASLLVSLFGKCLQYLEVELAGALVVGGVSAAGDVLKRPAELERARELGKSLAAGI